MICGRFRGILLARTWTKSSQTMPVDGHWSAVAARNQPTAPTCTAASSSSSAINNNNNNATTSTTPHTPFRRWGVQEPVPNASRNTTTTTVKKQHPNDDMTDQVIAREIAVRTNQSH